jgi:hypothetical protein
VVLEQAAAAAAAKIIIMIIPYTINNLECKNKSGTSNKRGNWNHLKITQTIPEQHTGKALHF